MNILVTGSKGFVGKNLVENLKNIRDLKNRTRNIKIDNIYEYDIDSDPELLDSYCRETDFVFNLAGVNRPKEIREFTSGNVDFVSRLLEKLTSYGNTCPIMMSSSIQASLIGKYNGSDYGKSKAYGEKLLFDYSKETGVEVFVYRFTNLFGKWCKPNYNSVVATFCNNIANGLPIQIHDENVELELLYIDDLVEGMLDLLEGKVHKCDYDALSPIEKSDGKFCFIPRTYKITLGEIVKLLNTFNNQPQNLIIPEIETDSLVKKLYSTFLSYLPKEKMKFSLKMNTDNRGSFTEILKTQKCGQVSINISNPGISKGEHWHNSKWEFFIVVSGHGLIQERKIGSDEIIEFEVSGNKIEAVHMIPGYTHNIINLSETENLVTVMWANEQFDSNSPDTFGEKVNIKEY